MKKKRNNIKHILACMLVLVLLFMSSCDEEGIADYSSEIRTALSSYTLVIPSARSTEFTSVSHSLANTIAIDGRKMGVATDIRKASGKEILVGRTNRVDSLFVSGLGPLDYVIKICPSGNIVLQGGSIVSTMEAVSAFCRLVMEGHFEQLLPEFSIEYRFYENHEHSPLSDRNSDEFKAFVQSWTSVRTVASWGGFDRDLKESIYALSRKSYSSGTGRIATFSHRGDMSNYPENSLEGIISAVLSGADTIEFDFRLTKDHVPVLVHDNNLKRVTNWEEMHGKNGLPSSVYVSEWTYDELMQLNLLDYYGKVTECKVASLYDAMLLAGGILQYSLDDKAKVGFVNEDYLDFAKATDSYESFIQLFYKEMGSIELLSGRISAELYEFAEECKASGSFKGASAFYNSSVFSNERFQSNYLSLNEDPTFWSSFIKSRTYVGTNQIYRFCRYLEEEKGMKKFVY